MDDFKDELITYYRKYQEKIYERVILAQNGDAKQLLKPKEKNGWVNGFMKAWTEAVESPGQSKQRGHIIYHHLYILRELYVKSNETFSDQIPNLQSYISVSGEEGANRKK